MSGPLPWSSPDADVRGDLEDALNAPDPADEAALQEITNHVAGALSDLFMAAEEGPQPLLSGDPDCPCERSPLDVRERGVQDVEVRLHQSCYLHGFTPPITVPVEIRRVPSPKENE